MKKTTNKTNPIKYTYATTQGELTWDKDAYATECADHPHSPDDGEDWEMVGSVIGALRLSKQPILWFWRKENK